MSVAIAHDYLTQRGGAERVVLTLARMFPEAPIYTLVYEPTETYPEFQDLDVRPSIANRLPVLRRNHRSGLLLYPFIANRMKIDADVVVASSSGWAHGFKVAGSAKLIVYCHNPARWLYQSTEYLGERAMWQRKLWNLFRRPLVRWDRNAARRADRYLSNSTAVSKRVLHQYGREATIVPPPVSIDPTAAQGRPVGLGETGRFALCVSRLLPYKNVDVVIEAARSSSMNLIVVGDGPDYSRLSDTKTPNVQILRQVKDLELRWLYANCDFLVGASYEDFGLTPIEANAFGKPALVLRYGGYLDTVIEGVNGYFFDEVSAEAISAGMQRMNAATWIRDRIVEHADRFSEKSFARQIAKSIS